MLQSFTLILSKTIRKPEVKENTRETLVENMALFHWNEVTMMMKSENITKDFSNLQ